MSMEEISLWFAEQFVLDSFSRCRLWFRYLEKSY